MGSDATTVLHFRVLGPLEAARDGEPVRLGGERQRALLALLLLHANELVSSDQLAEQLFAGETSAGAANALHAAVSRLRRVLHDGERDLLVTRPGGYLLALGPQQLDAACFERLVGDGRRQLAAGDPAAAAATLREALELWRGSPLADLSIPDGLRAEIRRLQELRQLALMERIDAELALGREDELIGEISKLVASDPLQERLRGQLMLALYRSGRQAAALAVYRETSELLREDLGLEPSPALRDLERMMLQHDDSLGPGRPRSPRPSAALALPTGAAVAQPGVCPFKGLASFDRADAEYFCGRERVVSDLVARLAESPLVGLLGPSGIGKSSLLRAGVLPALKAGALPRSAGWRQVLLRPGAHPCRGGVESAGADSIGRDSRGGELAAALSSLGPDERLVVAVDQLEELFTVCESEDERARFLDQLAAAACDEERRVVVLCALRADFYGRFGAYDRFGALLSQSHALVGPMDRDELRQAIEQPAARAGLEVEPALVDALVNEVVDEPGGLPLLSTTLLELWRRRDGRCLRFDSYRTSGGVRGAVSRLAESAYAQLTDQERLAARSVMVRLAGGQDGGLASRSVPLAELEGVDGVQRALATMIDARLLTVGGDDVELSHEALLREWPRYATWLEEDRIGRRVHGHLIAAAKEWKRSGREAGELYRGARLAGALEWAAQHDEWMSSLERQYLDASRREAERDQQHQRAQNRRLRGLLVGVGILFVVAMLAGVVALLKQQSASRAAHQAAAEARVALGRQLGAEALSEPRLDLAMLLAREAVQLGRSPQTEGALLATLLRSPAVTGTFTLPSNSGQRLAVSPDGGTLAVSDGTADEVHLYDTRTRSARRTLTDFVGDQAPVYSGDGSLLVYSAQRGAQQFLAVRDSRTLAMRTKLAFDARVLSGTAADIPGGSILVGPGGDSVYYGYWLPAGGNQPARAYLDRWSLAGGRLVSTAPIASDRLLALKLVDGGDRLVVATPGQIRVFDTGDMRLTHSVAISPTPAQPSAAAISPDGRTVAVGSRTGAVSFVDVATGTAVRGQAAHGGVVVSALFSPSGQNVVTVGGDDGKVIVWDPRRAVALNTLHGPAEQLQSAAMTPDGSTLYTSSPDGVSLTWDLTGARSFGRQASLARTLGCCGPLSLHAPPVALSADGARFAVAVDASTVGLFSTATLQRERTFKVSVGDGIAQLAWSPTAPILAVAGHSGVVQLWDMSAAPRLLRSLAPLQAVPGPSKGIGALAFSSDGRLMAASNDIQTRSLPGIPPVPQTLLATWRTATGRLIGPPRVLEVTAGQDGSEALAFAPGGRLLAATLSDGRTLLLNAGTDAIMRTLRPDSGGTALAFAPDGALAVGTLAGTVELWDPHTGRRSAPPLIAASAPVTSVVFDPAGGRFATSGYHAGAVRLWSTSTLQQEGPALDVDRGATSAATFESGGRGLLVVDEHGGAFTWPDSLGTWERRACAVAGRNMTRTEWTRLVAASGYTAICR